MSGVTGIRAGVAGRRPGCAVAVGAHLDVVSAIRTYLEDDHRLLSELLTHADAGGSLDLHAFEAFRARLLRHIGIEEKLLLATVREVLGQPIERARRIRVDHGAIASLLVPTPDVALVGEIRALLVTHDALEEGGPDGEGVYAECDRVLGARADALAERARAFPVVPAARHFDGPNVVRTAAEALRGAERMRYLDGR